MNKRRALDIMEKYKLDALIASKPANLKYISNYESYVLENIFPGNEAYAILPNKPDAKATVVCPLFDMEMAPDWMPYVEEMVPYGRFFWYVAPGKKLAARDEWMKKSGVDSTPIPTVLEAVAAVLKKLGLENRRIGLDESYFPTPKHYQKFVGRFPQAEFVDAYAIFREIRMVKTPEEIKLLEQIARLLETALKNSLALAAEGVSERDFQIVFERTLWEHGAQPAFTNLYFGETSSYNQVPPSPEVRLKRNMLIRYDVGCIFHKYYGDIARTCAFGEANEQQKQRFQAVRAAHEAALNLIKPGVKASDIFNAAVAAARKYIPEFKRTHVGHGIGLELYELPFLRPESETVLEEGMVFNVEPPYYELGLGAFQIEDSLVVTNKGYRSFMTLDRGLLKA